MTSFICYHCNSCYTKKFNLKRHLSKIHFNQISGSKKENDKTKRKCRILCYKCNASFYTFGNYHHHLKKDHSVVLGMAKLTFSNIAEFQNWKINFEKESSSTFIQTTSAKKINQKILFYFFCHRSFQGKKHKRKTETKEKSAGSIKVGKSCPAMMKAIVTNGTVEVEICSTHLGHECDIGRLRLSIEDRNFLAGKLSAGVPPRCILADIRQNAPSTNKDRIHYIKMPDLHNIKRAYGIACPLRYDNNDCISVESWIKGKEKLPEADNPVLFYKDQHSDYENFEKSDFILILMTELQKQRVSQFEKKLICIDGTHGWNNYDFQLFTILVLDEYDEGIPVAFCFSNKSTKQLYKLFFSEVKKAINKSIQTNVFMSDGEMAFYDAWSEIMSPATHQLICRWHLNKIWVTNLNKVTNAEKRNQVLQTLNSLMTEQDVNKFKSSLDRFLIRLRMDPETSNFNQYFNKNYVNNVHIWAQCYRMDVPIHTNIDLEALHKSIKYSYLNGKHCIRLDKTIYALLRLNQDKEFERLIKFAKQKPSKKLEQIKQSHEKSVECDENVEELGGEKWSIQSSTNHSQQYQVNLVKYEPCCVHICKKCKICLHMLTCSCHDYSVKQNICKHIHYVMRLQQQKNKNDDVSPEEFQNRIFHPPTEQNNSLIGREINQEPINDDSKQPNPINYDSEQSNIEKSRVLAKFSAIFDALETAKLSKEQLCKISKHLDGISAEISISSSLKEKRQPRIAPNKKITTQTYFSTKKQNVKKVFIPPSS